MEEDWVDAVICTSLGEGLFFYFRGGGGGISFKTMGRDLGCDFRGGGGGVSFKMPNSLISDFRHDGGGDGDGSISITWFNLYIFFY